MCVCMRVDFRAFLVLAIDADARLAPSPRPFIPTDRRSGTHLTWGKVLYRASLDAVKKIKIDALWGNRIPVVRPVNLITNYIYINNKRNIQ